MNGEAPVPSAPENRAGARRPFLRPTTIFWTIFFLGVVLMAAGCFVPYSAGLLLAYTLCLVFYGIVYFVYFGCVAPPEMAFYNWVYFFFLFPKKGVRGEYEVLLAVLFRHRDYSLYEIGEILIVVTLVFVLLARRGKASRRLRPWKPFKGLFWFSCAACIVGLCHLGLCLAGYKTELYDGLRMWRALWPLIVGGVIWTASERFIEQERQMARIMFVGFLAACGLAGEFLISKYTSLLPAGVLYFEFDPQLGNFRSAWQSTGGESGLLVGQMLIAGIGGAYGWLRLRRPVTAVACIGLFLYVILFTYNRGSLVAGLGAAAVIGWLAVRRWRGGVTVLVACLIALVIVDWSGKYWLIRALGVDTTKIGEQTFFDASSLSLRLGAQLRGIEVFLHEPLLGAGPGHLWAEMVNPAVPQRFDAQKVSDRSQEMYAAVTNPDYKTNSHNLGVDLIAEYGIAGLGVVVLFLAVMVRLGLDLAGKRFSHADRSLRRNARLNCIGAYAVLVGMCIYYYTQAAPLLFGLLALMLRMVIVARRSDGVEQPAEVSLAVH